MDQLKKLCDELGHKGNVFTCIKAPKSLQGTSGVGINDAIITVVERNARKIAHNSGVKIEATTGREMNNSKSGKATTQNAPSPNLDSSVWLTGKS